MKVQAICMLLSDIILLSDIRLGTDPNIKKSVSDLFLYNSTRQYKLHYNSSKNSRGVGILIATDCHWTATREFRDEDENILGIMLQLDNKVLHVFSIYGPNNDNPSFYTTLSNFLHVINDPFIIIGGDWNATISTARNNGNLDIYNMASPPSIFRSQLIGELSATHKLSDPYRSIYPHTRDFTFVPSTGATNRSRLDFFLISDSLLMPLQNCTINANKHIDLFDHKSVSITLYGSKPNIIKNINRTIITHPRFEDVVWAAVADTYLAHAEADPAQIVLQEEKDLLGRLHLKLRSVNALEEREVLENISLTDDINDILTEILIIRTRMANLDVLESLALTTDHDIFLEVLLSNIKGACKY